MVHPSPTPTSSRHPKPALRTPTPSSHTHTSAPQPTPKSTPLIQTFHFTTTPAPASSQPSHPTPSPTPSTHGDNLTPTNFPLLPKLPLSRVSLHPSGLLIASNATPIKPQLRAISFSDTTIDHSSHARPRPPTPKPIEEQEEDEAKRKKRYSEVYAGPRTLGSLLIKHNYHMTCKPDRRYFTGRAGLLRIATLIIAVASLWLGLHGFTQTPELYVGYGESFLILLSLLSFTGCIIVNITFIFLLLLFREVRCQSKWDQWNTASHALCSCFSAIASGLEFGGIFHVRRLNCISNPYVHCVDVDRDRLLKGNLPNLILPFRKDHYLACVGKLICSVMYCMCSYSFLKNNDQLNS